MDDIECILIHVKSGEQTRTMAHTAHHTKHHSTVKRVRNGCTLPIRGGRRHFQPAFV
jgi:hypothetical protein